MENNEYIRSIEGYRKINKEFIRFVQKINKDLRKSNGDLIRQGVMKEMKEFARNNIHL